MDEKEIDSGTFGHHGTFGHQIDATDKQIDQLVYQLYGLTNEEIALVEGAA